MVFNEGKRYFVDRRVIDRMSATGSATFASYFARLRSDLQNEVEQFINAFTINETYFYREDQQLRCLTRICSPKVRAKKPGEADPDLVRALFDGRGALFDRHLDFGELAASGRPRHRDRRVGYRHQSAGGGSRRDFWKTGADAADAGPDRKILRPARPGALANRAELAGIDPADAGEPGGGVANALAGQVRRYILPERSDLFRRRLAPRGGGKSL